MVALDRSVVDTFYNVGLTFLVLRFLYYFLSAIFEFVRLLLTGETTDDIERRRVHNCDIIFQRQAYFGTIIQYLHINQCYSSLSRVSKYHRSFFKDNRNKIILSRLVTRELGPWFESSPQLNKHYLSNDTNVHSIIRTFYTDIDSILNKHCSDKLNHYSSEMPPITETNTADIEFEQLQQWLQIRVHFLCHLKRFESMKLWLNQMSQKTDTKLGNLSIAFSKATTTNRNRTVRYGRNGGIKLLCAIKYHLCNISCIDAQLCFNVYLHWLQYCATVNRIDNETIFQLCESYLRLSLMHLISFNDNRVSFDLYYLRKIVLLMLSNFPLEPKHCARYFNTASLRLKEFFLIEWMQCNATEKRWRFVERFRDDLQRWKQLSETNLFKLDYLRPIFTQFSAPIKDGTPQQMIELLNQL